MTRPAKRKSDGRRHNGADSRGLTETTVLVSAPHELASAVADRAHRERVSTREAWRRAARAWLGWTGVAAARAGKP